MKTMDARDTSATYDMERPMVQGFLGSVRRIFNPRLERWLHRVNVPTHVIWGDGDRIIQPAYAEAFHRLIPGSTLTMIPNAGHLPHVERAAAVAQAMRTFLRN